MKYKFELVLCLSFLFLVVVLSSLSSIIAPYSYDAQDLNDAFAKISKTHILGTDNFGRDVFSRILYAIRNSLILNVASVTIAFCILIFLDCTRFIVNNQYFDKTLEFITNILLSIPTMVFLLILSALLGQGMSSLVICFVIVFAPMLYRNMNSVYYQCINCNYVLAEQVLGTPRYRIFSVHVLYDLMIPLSVQYSFYISRAMLTESTLSFLGFGIRKPLPSMGGMISDTKDYILMYPQQAVIMSCVLFFLVYSINVLGDIVSSIISSRK